MKKLLLIILPITLIVGLVLGVIIGINCSSKTEDKSFYSIGLPEGGEYDPNEIIIQVITNYDSGYNFENQGINFSFSDNESGAIHPYRNEFSATMKTVLPSDKTYDGDWQKFHESIIKSSIGCCIAEFTHYGTNGYTGSWTFHVKDVIYGTVPDETVRVIEEHKNTSNLSYGYERGHEYLLFFSYRGYSEVYNQLCYRFEGGALFDLTAMNNLKWHGGNIVLDENVTRDEFIGYIENLAGKYGFNKK
ncbi:MAG: hypothetical protein E7564_00190 [Ruminococcaceae bacterium]|nr:hypothetical protein [Oscillospiraceae bacterium]